METASLKTLSTAVLVGVILSIILLFSFASGSIYAASGDNAIMGEWRNDAELEKIEFLPDGTVKWTTTWKGYGDTATCTGKYHMQNEKSIVVEMNKTTRNLAVSNNILTLSEDGKTRQYLRGFPVVNNRPEYLETIIVSCKTSTNPTIVSAALLKLNPVELVIYQAHNNERHIAVHLEKSISKKALVAASADKTFTTAKLSSEPGIDRESDHGISMPIGSTYDELLIRTNSPMEEIKPVLSNLGGELLPNTSFSIVRFNNGQVISALLTLAADARFTELMAHRASQGEHVFIVHTSTKTSPEAVEKSILALKPNSINLARSAAGKRILAISTVGPDALQKAVALARHDKTFLSVEIPDTEKRRLWLWDYWINMAYNFSAPTNKIILYANRDVAPAKVEESIEKLGGEVDKNSGSMKLISLPSNHFIAGFLKAIEDPNFTGVSQDMKLGN